MTMNRDDLFMLHDQLTRRARILMETKNRDYGENDDPFRNFRRWGLLGIIVRLGDKLARLETYVDRGDLKVVDEQVRDTVLDIINYAVLFEGYNVDGARSAGRDTAGTGFTRASDQGFVASVVNSCAGDARSYSRGPRRGEGAEVIFPAFDPDVHVTGRTGAGGGHRRTVGGKHRQRKGKGRA